MIATSVSTVAVGTGSTRPWLRAVVLLWAVVLTALLVLGGVGLLRTGQPGEAVGQLGLLVPALAGWLLAGRVPGNPVGWLFLVAVTAGAAGRLVDSDRWLALDGPPDAGAALVGDVAWPLSFPLLGMGLLWFPDGRLPSHRWRPVAVVAGSVVLLAVIRSLAAPWSQHDHPGLHNPFGLHAVGNLPFGPLNVALLLTVALAAVSVVVRHRTAGPAVRLQIAWVAWAATIGLLAVGAGVALRLVGSLPAWLDGLLPAPFVILIPACIAAGILRQHLVDIDFLLNRTVLYASLSVVVIGGYVGAVAGLGLLIGRTGVLPSAGAALGFALLFHPLRVRALRVADRRLFGQRNDPLAVLAAVSESAIRSDGSYQRLAEALGDALRLPYVAVEFEGDAAPDATAGRPRGTPLEVVPLVHDGVMLGRLVLAARSRRDRLHADERTLLAAVAAQVADSVYARRLAQALQASRERIVRAREDERRRLRRDLHDGLGARLTGIGYLLAAGPGAAADPLPTAVTALAEAVAELRVVLDGLRPAALDTLGLTEALHSISAGLLGKAGIEIDTDLPARVDLAPATEVALVRIGTEAVANVVHHSGATRCGVRLVVQPQQAVLEVVDDGVGPAGILAALAQPAGRVGLVSMRERAEELGGCVEIARAPGGGTRLIATLPSGREPA